MYQAPPSMASQIGGLGLAAYGMFGNPTAAPVPKAEGGQIEDQNAPAGLSDLLLHEIEKG
jgi:hypothetical protein